MYVQQRQRGQRDMDDKTVERRRRIIRNALEAAQQNSGNEAQDEQNEVVHASASLKNLGHVCGNESLELRYVRIHHFATLRQLLDALQRFGTVWLAAYCFLDRLCELGGQCSLQADQRKAGAALFQADFQAVGGMRVNHHAVFFPKFAYGLQTILMRTLAGRKMELQQRSPVRRAINIKCATRIHLAPEFAHLGGVAPDKVEHETLEVAGLGDIH